MSKAEKSKSHIYQVALKLFAEKGFDQTSMRQIAQKAGVAAGGIYYHFPNKESLVFEYYMQSHQDHLDKVEEFLVSEKSFEKRLHTVIREKIEIAQPYKDMARALFRVAADPQSPLSPFSEDSEKLRDEVIELLEKVMNQSDDKFHPEVAKLLPEYLWLFLMGVILFWIHDPSENSKRTFQLIDQMVPLVVRLNQLMLNPLAGPIRTPILKVMKNFRLINENNKEAQ